MKSYLKCWQKYAVMAGRAGRKEYWHFFWVNFLINAVLTVLAINRMSGIGTILQIYSLAALLPSLSVGVRRFHDLGRSGMSFACYIVPMLVCLVLIPVVEWATKPSTGLVPTHGPVAVIAGSVVLVLPLILGIVLLCVLARRGQPEANQYGEPPVE